MWFLPSCSCSKAVILKRVERWVNDRVSGLKNQTQDNYTCSNLQSGERNLDKIFRGQKGRG